MNNVTPSMIKERIRLIKPTRPQAPTEYNLQYKRWPLRPFTYDTFRVDKKTLKRDIPKEKETKSAEDAETVNTFSSAYPCSTQSEQQSEDSSKLSVPSQYEEDKTDNVLSSALHTSTAKMHVRTNQSKMGKKQSACRPNTTLGTKSGQNADSTMKRLEKDFSNKLRYLTAYSNIASTKGTSSSSSKAVKKHRRREAWVREGATSSPSEKLPINKERTTATQEHQTNNSSPKLPKNDKLRIGDLCNAIDSLHGEVWAEDQPADTEYFHNLPSDKSMETTPHVKSESIIQMKPFDQQTTDTTRTSKTSNRNHLSREGKRTKPFTVDSMEQENLTQLYNNIPLQDLENLREMYRGVLGPGEDRGPDFHKQFASCSLDTERVQTFKERQGWNSSYSDEYKNWYPCHYNADKCKTTKNVETRHKIEKEEKRPKVPTLAEKKTPTMTKSVDDPPPPAEAEEKCKKISFEEQSSELKRKERDRIIKEADDIEEREFQALFEPGGKIKMDMESSSKFKAHPTKPPETPIWANKTVVSLGSGHWNLPLNKGDDWRLEEEDASVHAGNNPAYKLRFHYKDGKPQGGAPEVRPSTADPFIALYYPEKRTTSMFLTEYMRKFHRFPVQRKRLLV